MPRLKRVKTLTFKRWTEIYCADEFYKEGVEVERPTLAEGVLLAEEVIRLRTLLRRHPGSASAEDIDGEFPELQER